MNLSRLAAWLLPRRMYERLAASPLGKRLARGFFWIVVGTTISRGLAMAAWVAVARMLGREMLGAVGIIQGTAGMFQAAAALGPGITATKHVAEFRKSDPAKAGRVLALAVGVAIACATLLAVVLFLLAPWLAANVLAAPHLGGVLRIAALMPLFGALIGTQTGALAGLEAFRTIARVSLIHGLCSFPLLVLGATLGRLHGVIWALVASQIVGCVLNSVALHREKARAGIAFGAPRGVEDWRVLWKFSLPAAVSSLVGPPVIWACLAILANQRGGYVELGLLSAAERWRPVILVLPIMLGNASLPILSDLAARDRDPEAMRRVLVAVQGICIALLLPFGVGLMFLARPVMGLFGKGFAAGAPVLLGIVLGATVSGVGRAAGNAIIAKGRMWFGALQNGTWSALMLGFVWRLAPTLGARSYALGFAISYEILLVWSLVVLRKDVAPGMISRGIGVGVYLAVAAWLCLATSERVRLLLAGPAIGVAVAIGIVCLLTSRPPAAANFDHPDSSEEIGS